ncbi:hypothetical protein [Chryseobacterium sediminis]|uniref:Lipoprotein n=1 Tax=Chryseobacterium sediminis TaxID=1679494 RepID=A0A5B2U1W5_9FLAO|nr:hypothetical protein [Chryseobacterium sediminis]KAA2220666.1 hypothetical protein FW780_17485 [Chryseobacterium sediminis]
MNKFFFILSFLFLVISCKKNEQLKNYKDLNSREYFSIPTDLKNMRNIEKSKINDSLYKIKGLFNNYIIQGYMNGNKKVGWWEAFDNNTKEIVAKLEYKFIDDKEFVNQYFLFENKSIDTLNSKFYTLKKNGDLLNYRFYTSVLYKKTQPEGKLNYHFYSNGKEVSHLQCRCKKYKNFYDCEFTIPPNSKNISIRGNFWELFQIENGNVGENEIYVRDTLKQ